MTTTTAAATTTTAATTTITSNHQPTSLASAAAAAADLALSPPPKESLSTTTTTTTTSTSMMVEPFLEEQLSNDLAAFLDNPNLQAALADGSLDLASYSSTVEGELADLETKCIEAYRSKALDIANLAKELEHCDGILLGLQEMLLGFQADLGGLSGDIRQLQETSKTLGIQLHNRKAAALGLRDFLGRIILSPHLVNTIVKGPVNADFQHAIQELTQLYHDTHQTTPQEWSCRVPPCTTVAGQEMQTHIQQLRLVAVSRIREYFYQQLSLLRKPQTNIRILQSHGLLHYADLYQFLMDDAAPDIAKELFKVYTDSMAKTLYALFRTYQAQLIQLDATKYAATRQDVLAVEDAYLRDAITTKAKRRVDVFTLGNRANVLDNNNNNYYNSNKSHQNPIVAHVAISEHQTFPYERLLKSCLQHLVDAVTNEYVVCRQFFKRDAFGLIFPPTLQLLLEQLENYLFGCYDALCILLMIKVTHQFKRLALSRTIYSLDPFFDQITHLLWPRLKTVMELHRRSIKQATPQSLGGVDLHAHYVSRRFAEFTCSVLLILQKGNRPAPSVTSPHTTPPRRRGSSIKGPTQQPPLPPPPGSATPPPSKRMASIIHHPPASEGRPPPIKPSAGDMLLQDLNELLDEYLALLERLSEEHTVNIKRIVFMINNLDQAVCIFQERRVAGGKELNRILELLMLQRELFVEEELLQGFSKMIAFVQQTEASLATGQATDATVNIHVVESLVREFASHWRSGMESINRNVLSFFSNFRNGMEILKQVLTQLLLYYTRFQDVIRKVYKRQPPAFTKDLVPTTTILAEIKKYALAI
jgi:vacuolar protein sorting-associated protein 52